ncbi:MAG: DUF1223 domain-containing protein [bacterium]
MKLLISLFVIVSSLVLFTITKSQRQKVSMGISEKEPTISKGRDTAAVPVIVELFTSEGCSSCPPADEVLAKLVKTQPVQGAEIIALGEHVDYWNQLGWIDPFSSSQFSNRQSEYADAFGRDGVYTPQMIVDGHDEFAGGNMGKAREAIARAVQTPKANIELVASPGPNRNEVNVSIQVRDVPRQSSADAADVLLAVTENNLSSEVPRGENAGRSLRHIAVTRRLMVLGQIKAGTNSFEAKPTVNLANDWIKGNIHAVVLVQEHASRRVLGAALVSLSGK